MLKKLLISSFTMLCLSSVAIADVESPTKAPSENYTKTKKAAEISNTRAKLRALKKRIKAKKATIADSKTKVRKIDADFKKSRRVKDVDAVKARTKRRVAGALASGSN